jgi:DNA helicase HerA-like ATPase
MTTLVCVCALATNAVAQPQSGAVGFVAKLYQDFASEAIFDSPEFATLDLFSRPKATLARYLDDDLVALVMADRACSERKQEVCNLDFAPIWDAQDVSGTTVKISATKDPSRVLVELKFRDEPVRRLTYHMVKTPLGWRVHDIEYDSHESLVKMLKGK